MRLLVVEDEPRLAAGLRTGWRRRASPSTSRYNGTDGLWLAREHPYDAIVLDVMLPGHQRLPRLPDAARAKAIWTPILMLTAKDGEWDEVEGLDTGADDYLTKPFSYAVLVARLRALLRRGARAAARRAGGRRPAAGSGRAAGLARRRPRSTLTAPRAVAAGVPAAPRAARCVSKREILAHVWDFDFDGDPNIVEVYVRHLRNKLDRPVRAPAIETLRGRRLPAGRRWRLSTAAARHGSGARRPRAVATVASSASPCWSARSALVACCHALIGRSREAAAAQAADAAGSLESGGPPILAVRRSRRAADPGARRRGAVVAASPNVAGQPAVAATWRRASPRGSLTPLDDDEFVAVAAAPDAGRARRRGGGQGLVDVVETDAGRHPLLAVGLPLLLVVVRHDLAGGRPGAGPGRGDPREVDAISAAQLHRRVPQPAADDEIGRLAATMNRMLDRLEGPRRQRRFVADASHELRSPIAAIRQHAEVALAHPGRDDADGAGRDRARGELRMQALVDDLLLLARADEHVPLRRAARRPRRPGLDEARRLRSTTRLRVDTRRCPPARVDGDPARCGGCCATSATTPPGTPDPGRLRARRADGGSC